ncbi:Dynamin- GTPase protein [Tulasnella sp. 418]|nr:Dynamin- GTPase protein [Tulasnella sp. 418]
MGQTQQELNSFGEAAFLGDEHHKGSLILRLMTQFARDFVSSIEGTSLEISTKELSGGARIYYIFNDVFGHALESIDSTSGLTAQDIRTAIRNSAGPRPSLFVPEAAFDLLVKPQIKMLEAPSLRCVELVYEELVKICHNCTSAELQRFPHLHAQLIETVSELLRERLGPTSEYTKSLISIQAAYINTNHPDFIAGSAVAHSQQQTQAPRKPTDLPRKGLKAPITEVPNGALANLDDDDDDASSTGGTTPGQGGARSVSSTIHDRVRASSSKVNGTASASSTPPPHLHHHSSRHRHGTASAGPGLEGASTTNPKENFFNAFFGTFSSSVISGSTAGTSPVGAKGRDLVGKDFVTSTDGQDSSTGLPSSSRISEGSNAALDMKSLSKHIEAISNDASNLSLREEREASLIRSLIASYFSIVRQTIQDLVPKAVMHFLVNYTSQQVQNRLVSTLYKPDLFKELLHEDETLVNERTRVKALLDAYKEAFKTLSEVNLKAT